MGLVSQEILLDLFKILSAVTLCPPTVGLSQQVTHHSEFYVAT